MLKKLTKIFKHRWLDAGDVRRACPPELLSKLEQYVTASEARHSAELRICIEAGLPMRYLWRDLPVRERALSMFSKLRVWDTAQNNGVLIYLLLAEHSIEIVADRAIDEKATQVSPHFWQDRINQMRPHLQAGDFETGLTLALQDISALLVEHFPLQAGQLHRNEQSDAPVLLD